MNIVSARRINVYFRVVLVVCRFSLSSTYIGTEVYDRDIVLIAFKLLYHFNQKLLAKKLLAAWNDTTDIW